MGLSFSTYSISQTEDAEMEYLNTLLNKLSQTEILELSKDWRVFLEKNEYPKLPYNKDLGEIDYQFVYSYPELSKQKIFNRIKEYASINYGSLDAVLRYEDYNSGKIVLKGYFPFVINDEVKNFWGNSKEVARFIDCFYTVVYSINENKLKVNYRNIEFETTYGGYYSVSNIYIPEVKMKKTLSSLYPVTMGAKDTWLGRLNTMSQTTKSLENHQKNFDNFLKNTNEDMKF
jgi:hypothetical protein